MRRTRRIGASLPVILDRSGVTNSILFFPTFSQPRSGVRKCVFTNAQSGFVLDVFWYPGTSVPSTTHLMAFLYLCSSRSIARGPLKGALSKPLKGLRRTRGSCKKERKRIVPPRQKVIDLASGQINFFFKKESQNIESVSKPDPGQASLVPGLPQVAGTEGNGWQRCQKGQLRHLQPGPRQPPSAKS